MSLEIITGKTGEPHIDSEDIGAYNAYTIGKDSYLLNGLDMSITNANTLHVGTGEVLFQGRHVRIKGNGEDVAIANGTTGYKRNDILCLKYQKFPQNSDIESISLELVKGTPTTGTPADPAITTGSILNGDTVVYLKLARIVIIGLTPEAPVKLLSTVKTLAETNKSLADTAQTVAQIGASVDQLKNDTGYVYLSIDSDKDCYYRKVGKMVFVGLYGVRATDTWTTKFTLPEGLRPPYDITFAMFYLDQSGRNGGARILTNGEVRTYGNINSPYWQGSTMFFVD